MLTVRAIRVFGSRDRRFALDALVQLVTVDFESRSLPPRRSRLSRALVQPKAPGNAEKFSANGAADR
jgi:hypothetical protein